MENGIEFLFEIKDCERVIVGKFLLFATALHCYKNFKIFKKKKRRNTLVLKEIKKAIVRKFEIVTFRKKFVFNKTKNLFFLNLKHKFFV